MKLWGRTTSSQTTVIFSSMKFTLDHKLNPVTPLALSPRPFLVSSPRKIKQNLSSTSNIIT